MNISNGQDAITYMNKLDKETYKEENDFLRLGLEVAMEYEKQGKKKIAVHILKVSSDVFQLQRRIKEAEANTPR